MGTTYLMAWPMPGGVRRTLADKLSPSQAAELLQPYTLHKQPRLRALVGVLLEAVQARKQAED